VCVCVCVCVCVAYVHVYTVILSGLVLAVPVEQRGHDH
jgi:hypothetical protein